MDNKFVFNKIKSNTLLFYLIWTQLLNQKNKKNSNIMVFC